MTVIRAPPPTAFTTATVIVPEFPASLMIVIVSAVFSAAVIVRKLGAKSHV